MPMVDFGPESEEQEGEGALNRGWRTSIVTKGSNAIYLMDKLVHWIGTLTVGDNDKNLNNFYNFESLNPS